MATPLAGQNQVAYLNSTTPYICAILAYFCPNLVAMATDSSPLKIQVAHLNSRSPLNPTEHAKNSSIFCKKQKFVQFWLTFF